MEIKFTAVLSRIAMIHGSRISAVTPAEPIFNLASAVTAEKPFKISLFLFNI